MGALAVASSTVEGGRLVTGRPGSTGLPTPLPNGSRVGASLRASGEARRWPGEPASSKRRPAEARDSDTRSETIPT